MKYEIEEERILSDAQRLAIEQQAHSEMQAMYLEQQKIISTLRLQLNLERQGSAATSERYTRLLDLVGAFVVCARNFQDDGSLETELTERFQRIEEHITATNPTLLQNIETDHDLLLAELEASKWADSRIDELEGLIYLAWLNISAGDDFTLTSTWKQFEKEAQLYFDGQCDEAED